MADFNKIVGARINKNNTPKEDLKFIESRLKTMANSEFTRKAFNIYRKYLQGELVEKNNLEEELKKEIRKEIKKELKSVEFKSEVDKEIKQLRNYVENELTELLKKANIDDEEVEKISKKKLKEIEDDVASKIGTDFNF